MKTRIEISVIRGVLAKLVREFDPGTLLESVLHVIPKYHEENRKAFEVGHSLL